MLNRIVLFIILSFISLGCQISYAETGKALSSDNQQFIDTLVPVIHSINADIEKQRVRLQRCYAQFQRHHKVGWTDRIWLNHLAKAYRVEPDFTNEQTWTILLDRVDVLPTSLVLAQASNESAWGQSRFAKEGNNYFGQWCYTKGCGIVPARRDAGKIHEVQVFHNQSDSIKSYYQNLNTNATYQTLRDIRAQQREKQGKLDSIELAQGLTPYSQRKAAYVKSIQEMIQHFDLQQYDTN